MQHVRTALVLAALAALPTAARADRRYYAETYSAVTAPPGGLDVEAWSTLYRAPKEGGTSFWRHQLELETGLTDRWDLALYGNLRRDFGDRSRFEGLQLETRWRPTAPGEWPVDLVLYLEVKKEVIRDQPWAVEEKVILGKDLRAWNLSLNLTAEQEFPKGGGSELEWGWALATSYELHPAVRFGGEVYGAWAKASGEPSWERTAYAGPAVSLSWSRAWLVLGAGFGLSDASDRVRLRAVLALQL